MTALKIAPLFQPLDAELNATVDFLQGLLPPEALTLADATTYSLSTLGKLVRPAMVHALWQAITGKPSDDRVVKLAAVTEMIHLATLLHDDVLDEADLRRGKSTVRQRFGNRIAILGGDWLLAQASQTLASLGNLQLVSFYAQVLAELCEGEVLQNALAYQPLAEISWDAYTQKTYKKTASLYVCLAKSVAVLAEADDLTMQKAIDFGNAFGMAFQFHDDLLDYTADATDLGKPILDDIRNGLANAPILLLFQEESQQAFLEEAVQTIFNLVQEQAPLEAIDQACVALKEALHQRGGIALTQALIASTRQDAQSALTHFKTGHGLNILGALLKA
ncbi:MAG: polyprenyl synthetase family protein [Vampirovibrionales bacterium]|jgi:geranylgeranyl pyrophosphate synthase|nr:polyprenyl synthetase family protein [Vampirovibrionales bacterium]